MYRNEEDLALNNLQLLICHKTEPNLTGDVLGVKALGCRIIVSEFELQRRYYVQFRTNTLRKRMNPLILVVG